MKSPHLRVKERFGDKKKLVEEVKKFTGEELWVKRASEGKGLEHVSNAKLLRLLDVFSQVKEKFGTRFKLVDAILEVENRAKDEGYRTRLLAFPVPRLWDQYKSASKRKGAPATGAKPAAEGKPAAKAAPAAKAKAAAKAAAKGAKPASPKPATKKAPAKK